MKRIVMVVVMTVCFPSAGHSQLFNLSGGSTGSIPSITVQGEAVVKVTPDTVDIVLGIETWDKEMQAAKKQNNDILRRAIESIKRIGLAEKDVRTDHLSIEPRYDSNYKKRDFIGYFVRNSISLSLRNVDDVEELISAVLSAGVTHIHGVNFTTSEFKKHREEARRLALEAAKEKALKMTAVLGKTVGDPLHISEQRQYSHWYYHSGWGYGRGQSMSQNVIQNAGGSAADISDTIALGKISIKGSVSVSFALK